MAVQAQYPANLLLLDRAETDRNNKDMDCPPPSLLDQSPVFFSSNGANAISRKRGRDLATPMVFSTSPAAPSQLVSTGLRLALDEQNQIQLQPYSAFLSEDLSAQINLQKDEIEQFFLAQQEQLRRGLIDRRHRQYRTFLSLLEKSMNNRLREKDAAIELASHQAAELENRLARVRSESMAWQSKAMAEQAMAASLHAQLQRAAAAAAEIAGGEECHGESPAEDAESAYVDPERAEAPWRACRACLRRPASVVLVPCRHLCICPACDFAVSGEGCPVCGVARSGSVHVLLS